MRHIEFLFQPPWFNVAQHRLSVLGRSAVRHLSTDVMSLCTDQRQLQARKNLSQVYAIRLGDTPDLKLQKACQELYGEFPDLFKPELGGLKDFELGIKFKSDANFVFCKPRTVPLALLDDLSSAYTAGIQ